MNADVLAPGTVPWWEATPAGRTVPLAFVKIDRVGSTREWSELSPQHVDARHARYTAGVETIARSMGAAQPLHWQGDGVTLFLTDGDEASAPVRGFRAARLLWERMTVDLGIPVRIAVHAAHVPWAHDTGKLRHQAIDRCGHLEQEGPENAIVVSEDVRLTLPGEERRMLAPLGRTTQDGTPAWVFPAAAAERKRADAFRGVGDLSLWERFREYARSAEIGKLRYVGFPLAKKEPPALDIERVFIPLEVQVRRQPRDPLRDLDLEEARGKPDDRPPDDVETLRAVPFARPHDQEPLGPPEPFARLLDEKRNVVVLGDPGSGKTTLIRWLAFVVAGGPFVTFRELGIAERLLPLPVSIGALADIRRELGVATTVPIALARYVHVRHLGDERQLQDFLERVLEAGECLVLLDGLDEVRSSERDEIRSWLETFVSRYARNRFVVTSRHVGFSGFALSDGAVATLQPFTDAQVRRYVEEFTRAYRRWEMKWPDPATETQEASKLLEAVQQNPRLAALARSPFMLSALALTHRAEGRLPRHRVQFYATVARTLCETWGRARRIVMTAPEPAVAFEEEAIPILGALACAMHETHPAGAAPVEFVLATLAHALVERRGVSASDASAVAREFLKRAGDETQILLERGAGRWGFLHLTFQEFFAAAGLHAAERFEAEAMRHLLDPRWEEILRLGVGYLALVQNRPEAARRFVERVLKHRERGLRAPLNILPRKHEILATLLAAEAGDALPRGLRDEIAERFTRWVLDMPEDVSQRVEAEIALTDFRDLVVPCLLEALKSNEVRTRAITALGTLRAETAAPDLMELLKDEDRSLRAQAAWALGAVGSHGAVPALIEMLKEEDAWVQAHAAGALGELRAEAALPALVELMSHNGIEGHHAALALGAWPGQATVRALTNALKDERGCGRARAAMALGTLRAYEAAPALTELLRDADWCVRVSAAEALGVLGEPGKLAGLLNDKEIWVRERAAAALGAVGGEGAASALVATLRDEEWRVRARAATALKALRAEPAIPALLEALRDPDGRVRARVVEALGALGAEQAVPALREALQDREARVRAHAVAALEALRAQEVVPALLDALRDPDGRVRARAAEALGVLQAREAVPALLGALEDTDSRVRAHAVAALEALRPKGTVRVLLKALEDAAGEVRGRAAEALGALRVEAAIRPLVEYARRDLERAIAIRSLILIAESPPASARERRARSARSLGNAGARRARDPRHAR